VFACVSAPFGFVAQYVIEQRNHDVTKRVALRGPEREGGPGEKGCGVSPRSGNERAQRPLSLPVNLLFRAGLWRVPAEPGGVAGGGLRDGGQRVLPSWPPSARCRRGP
jgi:hypothetical protein